MPDAPDARVEPIISADDLKAAVHAGVISEIQAARLKTLAETRSGLRAALPADDEPLELFRGFNDVFVSVGLVMLFSGLYLGAIIAFRSTVTAGFIIVASGWIAAEYFIGQRRMVLPGIVLAVIVVCSSLAGGIALTQAVNGNFDFILFQTVPVLTSLAFYWRFRLPFALFLTGISIFLLLIALVVSADHQAVMMTLAKDWRGLLDLAGSDRVALTTLGFGVVVFWAAMHFDLSDRHRVGRRSACAFWLHLLAAPVIVNTVAFTLYGAGSAPAIIALIVVIAIIGAVALVIDRRSFLMSAAIYLGLLLNLAFEGGGSSGPKVLIYLILGGTITGFGAGWTQARGWIMRKLPAFPGKDRLPPYVARSDETP